MTISALCLLLPLCSLYSVYCSIGYAGSQPYYTIPQNYFQVDDQRYQRNRPHSAPEPIRQFLPNGQVYYSYINPPQINPHIIQILPIHYFMVMVPEIRVITGAPATLGPRAYRAMLSRSFDQVFPFSSRPNYSRPSSFFNSPLQEELSPEICDPIGFLKRAIYDSIKTTDLISLTKPKRTDINLRSFINDLPHNLVAKTISAETHINLFIEFVTTRYHKFYHESLLDYFDYIKTNHLEKEISTNPAIQDVIDSAVINLIKYRCLIQEVISDLVKLVGQTMSQERIDSYYNALVDSVITYENDLSKNGYSRYLSTLEAFLEFIPQIPFHIVLVNINETRVGPLRLTLHGSYIYQILMGFRQHGHVEISAAINLLNQFSNGSSISVYAFKQLESLDKVFKQVYYHIINADSDKTELYLDRFNYVAKLFVTSFSLAHFKIFTTYHMNNLLNFYIYFTIEDPNVVINFIELVSNAYNSLLDDKYFALYQVAIYLSNYEMTLSEFREDYKGIFLDGGIDEDFVLVLEAIIAATESVTCNSSYLLNWEPSEEYLILENKIMTRVVDPKIQYAIIDSPYLMLAAKIFLSRQIGYPISLFATTTGYTDGFTWPEAVDLVNFFIEKYFHYSKKSFKIKSQLYNDLKEEIQGNVDFNEIMKFRQTRHYDTTQKIVFIPFLSGETSYK